MMLDRAKFYIWAAFRRDLDAEDADLILRAEGLNSEEASLEDMKTAVNKNIENVTPAGPTFNWPSILKRAGE